MTLYETMVLDQIMHGIPISDTLYIYAPTGESKMVPTTCSMAEFLGYKNMNTAGMEYN